MVTCVYKSNLMCSGGKSLVRGALILKGPIVVIAVDLYFILDPDNPNIPLLQVCQVFLAIVARNSCIYTCRLHGHTRVRVRKGW